MKKFLPLIFIAITIKNYAQWHLSLTLNASQSFAGISAPDNKNIWAITNKFVIYKTKDAGTTWVTIHPKGFGVLDDLSIGSLYVIDSTTALLSLDSIFTGVGPGFIYRTTNGGIQWQKVFSHRGNCNIKMGMFNKNSGMMSCSFDSFNGSVKSGQKLYTTKNEGITWIVDTINPSNYYSITDFLIIGNKVGMIDGTNFYFSPDAGSTWTKQKESGSSYLQFEDSNYAINNSSANIDLLVRHPRKQQWKDEGDPTGIGGAVEGLVLDGRYCWFGMGLDTKNNYFSSDSARTFKPLIVDSTQGFVMMTKSRTGKTIIGATPFFGTAKLWINPRKTSTNINEVEYETEPVSTNQQLTNLLNS